MKLRTVLVVLSLGLLMVVASAAPSTAGGSFADKCKAHQAPNGSFWVTTCAAMNEAPPTSVQGVGKWWKNNSNGSATRIHITNIELLINGSSNPPGKRTGDLGWFNVSTSLQQRETGYNWIYLPGKNQYQAKMTYTIRWPNGTTTSSSITSYVT
jgi:hypothetical protein